MSDTLTYTCKLIIGDPGGCGHCCSDVFIYETNYSSEDILAAYTKSCKDTGRNFHDELLSEYLDDYIPLSVVKDFVSLGIMDSRYLDDDYRDDNTFRPKAASTLIMDFIGLSLPHFEYKQVEDNIPSINGSNMFGYGCYAP